MKYYIDKFKNAKQNARLIEVLLKKQNITGGGSLTPKEKNIISSPGYLELANKLGKSAYGNVPRSDNDAENNTVIPPTERLRGRMDARLFSGDSIEENVLNGNVVFKN